jgi:3-dehydroquinate synthase
MTGKKSLKSLRVELAERSYDILIGDGLVGCAGELIADVLARPRVVIVTDNNVAELHLNTLTDSLTASEIAFDSIILPAGEGSKDFTTLQKLLDQLLTLRVERRDTVIALGGGVIGDLTGFAAAILRRGMAFIQIPTSLLAQVDSSVGGKTGINTAHGKNLVGAFHQPKMVLADVGVLGSLPRRELLAGYAEVAKYGLLGNAEFFAWLEANGERLVGGDLPALSYAVLTSCQMKADIVAKDERESGVRALLNLGHTIGHALEAEAGYGGSLLHGEAVGIGMVQSFKFSTALGYCNAVDSDRVAQHLSQVGLPTTPRQAGLNHANPADLIEHMRQDKKVEDGKMTFILARGIGDAFITRDVAVDDLEQLLAGECAA